MGTSALENFTQNSNAIYEVAQTYDKLLSANSNPLHVLEAFCVNLNIFSHCSSLKIIPLRNVVKIIPKLESVHSDT